MSRYSLDPAGHITDAYPVECRSDEVALNAARGVWQWTAGVEVWEGSRREPASALRETARGRTRPVPKTVADTLQSPTSQSTEWDQPQFASDASEDAARIPPRGGDGLSVAVNWRAITTVMVTSGPGLAL